uniref:Uncharacterized protein n=1 Tax=Romanomermis culicivorax TaxID=13658 RepID=A0A915JJX1_ROMCU
MNTIFKSSLILIICILDQKFSDENPISIVNNNGKLCDGQYPDWCRKCMNNTTIRTCLMGIWHPLPCKTKGMECYEYLKCFAMCYK